MLVHLLSLDVKGLPDQQLRNLSHAWPFTDVLLSSWTRARENEASPAPWRVYLLPNSER